MSDKNITTAQIEAAAKALYQSNLTSQYCYELAEAALTAAAQVGDVEIDQLKRQLASWQIVANQGAHIEAQLRKDLLTVECCTIERCAQVAEEWIQAGGPSVAAAIAATLRKLKDEP